MATNSVPSLYTRKRLAIRRRVRVITNGLWIITHPFPLLPTIHLLGAGNDNFVLSIETMVIHYPTARWASGEANLLI